MIRLTDEYRLPVVINPDQIRYLWPTGGDRTKVMFFDSQEPLEVMEPFQEVARKVLEWRLAMERYRAYVNAAALDEKPQSNECWELAANAKAELVRLAGLEEPKNEHS